MVSAQFKLLFLFLDLNEQKRLVLLVLKHNTQFLSSLLPYFILSYPELAIIRAILALNVDNALTNRILSALSAHVWKLLKVVHQLIIACP